MPASDPHWSGRFELRRCAHCGTAVTCGSAPDDTAHEQGAYGQGAPRLSRAAAPVLRAFDRRRLSFLGPALSRARPEESPPRLLDVGAGRGRFVAFARSRGVDAAGIEPSRRGVQAAQERYGVELQATSLRDANVSPGSVDALTLWHVLEHVERPDEALDHVRGWLAPGGTLLIGVPNLASVQAALGGARWFHLDVPRHRTHFTPRGLDALLRRSGFEPVSTHHLLLEHNPFGMWQSLVNRVTRMPSYAYHLLKRNAPVASGDLALSAVGLALVPAAVVLEVVAGLLRRGGTIAVVARRPAGR